MKRVFIDQEQLEALSKVGRVHLRAYPIDQVIYHHGQLSADMAVVVSGKVAIQSISKEGDLLIVSTFGPGEVIGANLMFAAKNTYPMTVVAVSEATLAHISKEEVLCLCQEDKNFLLQFLSLISDRTLLLTDKLQNVAQKSLRQRLTDYLMAQMAIQGQSEQGQSEQGQSAHPRIILPCTKKALAEQLGVQRTSLSRELDKMRKEGLITFDSHTVTWLGERV